MKRIRTYTGIWRVEKVFYAINDFQLPRPITFTQIGWFLALFLFALFFGDMPPLSFINSGAIKFIGIPVAGAFFLSKKTFDGKKPHKFLMSYVRYLLRSKTTCRGKARKLKKGQFEGAEITVRRRLNG